MNFAKGTVKKYSREYSRTLKNGEKKVYKTEQIQVTIPKGEDIFENGEDVLILPKKEEGLIKDVDEQIAALEVADYINNHRIDSLNSKINQLGDINNNPEYINLKAEYDNLVECRDAQEKEIEDIQKALNRVKNNKNKLTRKYTALKKEKENYKTMIDENESLKKEHERLMDKNEQLNINFNNLKNSSIQHAQEQEDKIDELNSIIQEKEKEIKNLTEKDSTLKNDRTIKEEFNELLENYNALSKEYNRILKDKKHNDYLAMRYREFILKKS